MAMEDAEFDIPLLHRPDAGPHSFEQEFECSAERYGWGVMPDHGIDLAIIDQASSIIRVDRPSTSRHPNLQAWNPGDAITHLSLALDKLADILLAAIARFLWLEPDWFVEPTRGRSSALHLVTPGNTAAGGSRFLPADDLGAPVGLFTLTLAPTDVVLDVVGRGGIRRRITLRSGTLLLTMGGMLQRLTNDVLPATSYRVINPGESSDAGAAEVLRFSVPFRDDYLIRTLPECGLGTARDLYPVPVLAGDLRSSRANDTEISR